jgi:hypothetical protein
MHKLALNVDGLELSQSSPAVFETRIMSTGAPRIVLSVPDAYPDLLGRLAALLTPPFFVLYILHTPRGEGEPGRYQSSELSRHELDDLLSRYTSFFASDGRHDLWVHSPASGHTLIWDRHNLLFVEGQPLDGVKEALFKSGFSEGLLEPLGAHVHYFRAEFDADAASLLNELDWYRTPLRPEDEQYG